MVLILKYTKTRIIFTTTVPADVEIAATERNYLRFELFDATAFLT